MKDYLTTCLLFFICCVSANAQDDIVALGISSQPSSMVHIALFKDRYTGGETLGQNYWMKITNLTNQKVRVKGLLIATTVCGTQARGNFNDIIGPNETVGGRYMNSSADRDDDMEGVINYLNGNCLASSGLWQKFPYPNNPSIFHYNTIRSVSIENFGATVYKDDDAPTPSGDNNTSSNSNNNSYSSSQSGSSYHTAMNANDPRGDTYASNAQQNAQRQGQLSLLNQKLNEQAQKYNNVTDAVKSLANLIIGSMTQSLIRNDIKARNERFNELQNDLNTKQGILVDCSECNGEGYFICTECNGNGYKGDGDDRTICSKCYGLGKVQCIHCRGTGKEFKEDFEAEYGRKSSPDNNGGNNIDNGQQSNTQSYNSKSNDEDDPSSPNFTGAGTYTTSEIPKYAAQFAGKGQYRAAFSLYRIVTRGGYPAYQEQEADNAIASYYEQGKYVTANADSARKYYARARALSPPSPIPGSITAGAKQTASGLYYIIEKQGYGSKPVSGQKVKVQYTETLVDGTKIGSSYDNNEPLEFTLGTNTVIKGFEEGVCLMNTGGKVRVIIPPSLAYGNIKIGNIPANATLIVDLELINVQ